MVINGVYTEVEIEGEPRVEALATAAAVRRHCKDSWSLSQTIDRLVVVVLQVYIWYFGMSLALDLRKSSCFIKRVQLTQGTSVHYYFCSSSSGNALPLATTVFEVRQKHVLATIYAAVDRTY